MYRNLERLQTVFTGIAAHRGFGANLAYQGNSSAAQGHFVSGSYFAILGLRPALARLLASADDETPGAHRLVVLSHAYWTEKFSQNTQILNQVLLVNGVPLTIVGVAPRDFSSTTLGSAPQIFARISLRETLTPGWKGLTYCRNYWIYTFARLKPGVALEQAQAGINGNFKAIPKDVELPFKKGPATATGSALSISP